jgi:hypothetical protein
LNFSANSYTKIAVSMAKAENGAGYVFQGGAEITPVGEPLLPSEAEAELWKPIDLRIRNCFSRARCTRRCAGESIGENLRI